MNLLIPGIFAILVLLFRSFHGTNGLRILAIFPLHSKSHFAMGERLAKGLAERGHQLDVYSHFPQKKTLHRNYRDVSLAGSLPPLINNVSYELTKDLRNPGTGYLQKIVGEPVCGLLGLPVFRELIKNPPKYDLLIIAVFFQNCYLAFKRHLGGIPMVGVVTSSLYDWMNVPLGNPFNPASTPGAWSHFYHPMSFRDRLLNTINYHTLNSMVCYQISAQDDQVNRYFGPGYPTSADLIRDLDLVLVNSHHSIDGIKPLTPAIIPVGGLHVVQNDDSGTKLSKEIQSWLDNSSAGFIYISFGSMVRFETFPLSIIEAFYAAFEAIKPVRVLLKIARPEELPPGLPINVLTNSWLPQLQVLGYANIRLFVTHGGLMSTQESIVYGVPMVGIPLFADQYSNIRTYVRKRVAVLVGLEDLNNETLTSAILGVLSDPRFTTNVKQLSSKFLDRPMPPMEVAAFWIEYLGRHGPRTLSDPVTELAWYQAHLLDVYGFLLLGGLIIIYSLKLLVIKLMSLVALFDLTKGDDSAAKYDSRIGSRSKKNR